MKKVIVVALALASLMTVSACTRTTQTAAIGATAGGILGGITTGNVTGAAVGALVGGAAGMLVGEVAKEPGKCYFRGSNGQLYVDNCPRG